MSQVGIGLKVVRVNLQINGHVSRIGNMCWKFKTKNVCLILKYVADGNFNGFDPILNITFYLSFII